MEPPFLDNNQDIFRKKLMEEYKRTTNELEEYIDMLRKWAHTQLHFPEKPGYRILRFMILYNKFSIEKAKQKLDMYYTIRTLMPEVYNKHPLWDKMILKSKVMYCIPLPKYTSDFKRVIYSQVNPNYGPEFFVHELYACHVSHVLELIVQEDDCFNCHFIFDCAGFKLGHIPRFSPMVVRNISIIMEKVYSNRVSSIIMVNFHPYMENVLNTMIIPMLHPKLKNRIKVFSNTDALLDMFGKAIMPKDVGGEEKSLEELNEIMLKKFEDYQERYEFLRTAKTDESVRPTKLVNDDILGYYGNFRKINVD